MEPEPAQVSVGDNSARIRRCYGRAALTGVRVVLYEASLNTPFPAVTLWLIRTLGAIEIVNKITKKKVFFL